MATPSGYTLEINSFANWTGALAVCMKQRRKLPMSVFVNVENETRKEGIISPCKLQGLGGLGNAFSNKPKPLLFLKAKQGPVVMASLGCSKALVVIYVGRNWSVTKIGRLAPFVGFSGGIAEWVLELPEKEYLNNVRVGDRLSFTIRGVEA